MQRIAVVGCSGGGKSTLARRLGERLNLPVVHFDALFWLPGWVESPTKAFRAKVAAALAGERWIADGNFSAVADIRFPPVDTIVWLEAPRWLCLWRAISRSLTSLGRTRADLAPGCPERLDLEFYRYIWSWNRATRPKLQQSIETYAPTARLVRLRNDAEVRDFLKGL